MKTLIAIVSVVLVASGLLDQAYANPLDMARAQDCLREIEAKVANLETPAEIKKLVADIRSSNDHSPALKRLSFAELLVDDKVNIEFSVMPGEEQERVEHICQKFMFDSVNMMKGNSCSDELMVQIRYEHPDLISSFAGVEDANNYALACLTFLHPPTRKL